MSGGPLFKFPIIESLSGIQVLKEINIEINKQSAITKDNVTVDLDGVLYIKVGIFITGAYSYDRTNSSGFSGFLFVVIFSAVL